MELPTWFERFRSLTGCSNVPVLVCVRTTMSTHTERGKTPHSSTVQRRVAMDVFASQRILKLRRPQKRRTHLTNSNRVAVCGVALLLIVSSLSYSFFPVMANAGQGTFVLDLTGYSLNGNLQNAIVKTSSVSMNMILNGNLQTSIGQVPITASGVWVGTRNGSRVSGLIQGVSGTVHACFLFWCGKATFIGQGEWSGTLSSTQGTGVFDGTITFTTSDFPQIHLNQPALITGTWTADFQLI